MQPKANALAYWGTALVVIVVGYLLLSQVVCGVDAFLQGVKHAFDSTATQTPVGNFCAGPLNPARLFGPLR